MWGSYWREHQWGYSCCHSFIRNSYCIGESGKLPPIQFTTTLTSQPKKTKRDHLEGEDDEERKEKERKSKKKKSKKSKSKDRSKDSDEEGEEEKEAKKQKREKEEMTLEEVFNSGIQLSFKFKSALNRQS